MPTVSDLLKSPEVTSLFLADRDHLVLVAANGVDPTQSLMLPKAGIRKHIDYLNLWVNDQLPETAYPQADRQY